MIGQDFYAHTHENLKLHGKVYAADDIGDAPPEIICLHGLTRSEKDFRELAAWLATQKINGQKPRVHCLTFRGRARSEYDPVYLNYQPPVYVQDVAGVMEQLDLSSAHFIGTSLGGIVSMLLACLQPNLVQSITLNDIGPELAPEGLARIAAYVGTGEPVSTWDEAAQQIRDINEIAFPNEDEAFWHNFARNTFCEKDGKISLDYDDGIAKAIRETASTSADLWPVYKAITSPILSIRGALSDLFTEEIQNKMSDHKGPFTAVTLPNRGHAPTLDEPDARMAIADFLSTHS